MGWIPSPQGSRTPKIVPRVLFELGADAPQLASEAGVRVVQLLQRELERAKFDGYVLEVRAPVCRTTAAGY